MKKEIIYEVKFLYREPMQIAGYTFGEGEKTLCIVGATRGNEVQQMYQCACLIQQLQHFEAEGLLAKGHKIMVIPTLNSYSMNVGKRFWTTDNTDINRMFPGYDQGETTQRIAGGVFSVIKEYAYGIHFTSFYMPGFFTPHVRMMKTGYEQVEMARDFGLPYVVLRQPRPYDSTTLHYNWQIWETNAFSIYTSDTMSVDHGGVNQAVQSVLRFLNRMGILQYRIRGGYISEILEDSHILNVKGHVAGLFLPQVEVETRVKEGDVLGEIRHPCEGHVVETILAPATGTVFFSHNRPLVYERATLFRLIPDFEKE